MRKNMRCFFHVFILIFSIFHHHQAQAQNWTTVSASNITDLNQIVLAAGRLCFLGTDFNDKPINFQVGGGGQVLARPFCSNVSNGIVTSFTVPNPANTSPIGIVYRVTVVDSSTGQQVLLYKLVAFLGTTFNFDTYVPGFITTPTGQQVTGNLLVTGVLQVGAADTGISRAAASPGVFDFGNGTASDTSGTLQASVIGIAGTTAFKGTTLALKNPAHSTGTISVDNNGGFLIGSGLFTTSLGNAGTNGTFDVANSLFVGGSNFNAFQVSANGTTNWLNTTAATVSLNQNSPSLSIQGDYWDTGLGLNQFDTYTWQDVLGAGSNPSTALTLTHTGSTGLSSINLSGSQLILKATTATGPFNLIVLNGRTSGAANIGVSVTSGTLLLGNQWTIDSSGNLQGNNGVNTITFNLAGGISWSNGNLNGPLVTPATSTAACTTGSAEWDASFIYICTATNNWKRSTLAAF